jgi:hypothetical protein
VISDVPVAVTVMSAMFLDMISRNLVKVGRHFEGGNQAELLVSCLVYSSTLNP